MDAELRQQPVANERADYSDDEIADQSESGPAHDLAGQPAGEKTDHQDDQKTFRLRDAWRRFRDGRKNFRPAA
jgi:hypothetical protein